MEYIHFINLKFKFKNIASIFHHHDIYDHNTKNFLYIEQQKHICKKPRLAHRLCTIVFMYDELSIDLIILKN